jgi:transmembrane sensor
VNERTIEALKAADRALADQTISREADRRIRAQIRSLERRPTRIAPFALAAASFATGALCAAIWIGREARVVPPKEHLGLHAAEPTCQLESTSDRMTVGGTCLLEEEGFSILASNAVISREGAAVRVARGTATFDVAPVPPGKQPFRVLVSGGVIEVIGTRFVVIENGDRGRVELVHGKIRFIAESGDTSELSPGEGLSWPKAIAPIAPPPPEPLPVVEAHGAEPKPRPNAPPVRAPKALEVAAPPVEARALDSNTTAELARLRAEGRYEEAVSLLARLLDEPFEPRSAELLSFERASILDRQLRDRDRACTAYEAHRARFSGGRYDREIRERIEILSCGGNSPEGRE